MKTYQGDLIIDKDTAIDFEEITGNLWVKAGVKFKAPNLETVGGYLFIYSETELPNLETVGGWLSIYSKAKLPNLETVGGWLSVYSETELPNLEAVGGYLDIYSDTKLPKLETVGGYLYIGSVARFEAPNLETVGGYLSIHSKAELPNLETVGGYLFIYSKAKLPNLETVGGSVSIYSYAAFEAPNLKNQNDPEALAKALKKKNFALVNGILSRLVPTNNSAEVVSNNPESIYVNQNNEKHRCRCEFRDLMMNGCQCGGIQFLSQ